MHLAVVNPAHRVLMIYTIWFYCYQLNPKLHAAGPAQQVSLTENHFFRPHTASLATASSTTHIPGDTDLLRKVSDPTGCGTRTRRVARRLERTPGGAGSRAALRPRHEVCVGSLQALNKHAEEESRPA